MENSLIRARETTENNEKTISNFFGLSFLWINYIPSETKLDTPCQDMQVLDIIDKTWVILPRS